MLIDCDTCSVRGAACRDCVISVILRNPPIPTNPPILNNAPIRNDVPALDNPNQPVELDDAEQLAVAHLAEAGLLPPLRLVPLRRVDPLPGVASVQTAS